MDAETTFEALEATEERGRELMTFTKTELVDLAEEKGLVRSEMEPLSKRAVVSWILDQEGYLV